MSRADTAAHTEDVLEVAVNAVCEAPLGPSPIRIEGFTVKVQFFEYRVVPLNAENPVLLVLLSPRRTTMRSLIADATVKAPPDRAVVLVEPL